MATPTGASFLWEARNVASKPADGALLASMLDQSGNANDAPQGTSTQRAIWRTAGINGQPAADFEGGVARYQFPAASAALSMLTSKPGATVIVVTQDQGAVGAQPDTIAERTFLSFSRGTSSAVRFEYRHGVPTGTTGLIRRQTIRRLDADASFTLNTGAVPATATMEGATVDWTNQTATNWINGELDGTGTTTLTAGNSDVTASQSAYIGMSANAADFYDGLIAYIAIWPRVLTVAEVRSLYADLQPIYGLPAQSVTASGPTSDVTTTGWKNEAGATTNLFASLDETTPLDTDYVRSPFDPVGSILEEKLPTMTDPGTSTGHQVSYRVRSLASTSNTVLVALMEGTNQIAQWSHTNLPSTYQTFTQTLTAAQTDSIVDYSNLRIRISATAS